jgi:serine/threonine-protein kinase
LTAYDVRAAWTGVYPDQPDIPIRIEAAAYRGKTVHFAVVAPWSLPWLVQEPPATTGQKISAGVFITLFISVCLFAAFLARRNLRGGRGDRRGALRLSAFVFAACILAWAFGADHTPTSDEVKGFFFIALSQSLLVASMTWLAYLALEPYVRRRWPETIVSWNRLLGGGLRDPLVGKDILVGVVIGVFFTLLTPILENYLRLLAGVSPIWGADTNSWLSARRFIANGLLAQFNFAIGFSLLMFLSDLSFSGDHSTAMGCGCLIYRDI